MIPLTKKQRLLLEYLRGCEECPSFVEMSSALGLKSKSGVHRLLTALEERGFICRLPNRARSIEVLDREAPQLSEEADREKQIEIELEGQAVVRLKAAIQTIADDVHWYWRWGDGEGGYVLELLREAVTEQGCSWPGEDAAPTQPKKAKIGRSLAKLVFERDSYRCVTCGSHLDLCCDHIKPESKGGPTTFANLQTMCRPCNSKKGARE